MKKNQETRSLKVHKKYRDNKQVPELRLLGKWLETLGFCIGDRVQITTRERLLIIEPLKEEKTQTKPSYQEALEIIKANIHKRES